MWSEQEACIARFFATPSLVLKYKLDPLRVSGVGGGAAHEFKVGVGNVLDGLFQSPLYDCFNGGCFKFYGGGVFSGFCVDLEDRALL